MKSNQSKTARTVGETAAAPHPLDGASSPLVRALPAYERQFCLHLQRAEVLLPNTCVLLRQWVSTNGGEIQGIIVNAQASSDIEYLRKGFTGQWTKLVRNGLEKH